MSTFMKAATMSEIPSGTKKTIMVGGKKIALANVDGDFFAIDDACTHQQCSLGTSGFLDGSAIICGCHGAQFDVTTGVALSLPATVDVSTYETKIEGNDIFINI